VVLDMENELLAVAKEIISEMLAFDDEMFSVHMMKKYNITPEEYVRARQIVEHTMMSLLK